MFVCFFAKKFPALASQSCCEVSCPKAVGEYEYRLFPMVFIYIHALDDLWRENRGSVIFSLH